MFVCTAIKIMVCARAGQGLGLRSLRGGLDGEEDEDAETTSRDSACCESDADAMVMEKKIKKLI